MTNGEKIKQIFPDMRTNEDKHHTFVHFFIEKNNLSLMSGLGARKEWWDSEYKESEATDG